MSILQITLPDLVNGLFVFFSLVYRNFDSTLGYPGEGPGTEPKNQQWKCISANIDSIQSNIDFLNWDHDICFLQETRLSNLNFDTNLKTVKKCGKHIFPGGLLKEKADKNGTFKTPHGGCAILAPQATTRAFESKDDATGLWDSLHRTTRVSAVWHQISKNTRVLCVSFYGHSGVNDNNNLEVNDHLIDNILTVCSQFGDIPIIFSGDFQADPDQYHSISCAKHTGVWFDPLVSCDADGSTHRPITFSRNSDFINPQEYFSSIDAMLVNSIALAALKQMRVCHEHCRPHAPIEATFEWSRLCQTGYILRKPAAFDFTSIAKINDQVDLSHLQEISEKYGTPSINPASKMHRMKQLGSTSTTLVEKLSLQQEQNLVMAQKQGVNHLLLKRRLFFLVKIPMIVPSLTKASS